MSLANILFLPVWTELRGLPFYVTDPVNPRVYLAAVAGVLVTAAAIWASVLLVRALARRVHVAGYLESVLLLAALTGAANWLRLQAGLPSIPRLALASIAFVVVGLLALATLRYYRFTIRAAGALLIVLLPFVPITFGEMLWRATVHAAPAPAAAAGASDSGSTAGDTRVLWIIFDELDAKMLFEGRPPGTTFPAFDRLRAESLFATAATPPAGATRLSIPSLLRGAVVAESVPQDAADMTLTLADGTRRSWRDDSVFATLRARGVPTHVAGWYLPYCEGFVDVLTTCVWQPARSEGRADYSLVRAAADHWGQIVLSFPLVYRLAGDRGVGSSSQLRLNRVEHAEQLHALEAAAIDLSVHADGFSYVHLPVPHLPVIFDRRTGQERYEGGDYLDNVALADRVMADIRSAMEAAGTWAQTTVIVSADHWWRNAPVIERRVPFFVKLPAQSTGFEYVHPINTVATRHLVEDLFAHHLSTPQQLALWLDQNAGSAVVAH